MKFIDVVYIICARRKLKEYVANKMYNLKNIRI